jgi:GAF domain-containing protein
MFPVSDWTISLFFLLALILVAKFKKQIGSVDPSSYRDISWGVSILALVSLLRLYRGIGVLNDVPFISHAAFYDLICWIGMISGVTLIIGGVSSWLPVARARRQTAESKISRLEFVQAVEQHVAVEGRLYPILSAALRNMIGHFHFSDGAVFTCSPRRSYLQVVSTTMENEALNAVNIAGGGDAETDWSKLSGLPRNLGKPHTVLPVIHAGRAAALFVLWADGKTVCDDADTQSLKIAAGIIARKISADHLNVKNRFLNRCDEFATRLEKNVSLTGDLKHDFRQLADTLISEIPFDTISLTYRTRATDRFGRITIGQNGSLLVEKDVTWQGSDSLVGKTFVSGEPTLIHDAHSASLDMPDMHPATNIGSCLSVPMTDSGAVTAVLILTARKTGQFSVRNTYMLSRVAPVVSRIVQGEHNFFESASREKRIVRLNRFVDSLSRLSSTSEVFENAVRLLASEIPASLVRLSTVEDGGSFLKSEALKTQRPLDGIIPADGRLILSIMPYHRLAIGSGRPVLVTQDNPDTHMSDAEASQALTGQLSSALIIPVVAGKQVPAVISLAEMRSGKRFSFDHPEVLFAEMVGKCLGLALQRMTVHRAVDMAERRRQGRTIDPFQGVETMNRVKSPLTSLLGSVEILRNRQGQTDKSLDRYLDIIDRSAHKLGRFLEEQISAR